MKLTPSPVRERRIVLASRSPRRLGLLRGLGFDPFVRVPELDEHRASGETHASYTRRLSEEKAFYVAATPDVSFDETLSPWVVAADTVVVLGQDMLEKPTDEADARRMLKRLSGRQHRVITSFTVQSSRDFDLKKTGTVEADVQFKALSDETIARYVASGEPLDKAGAYGIQELGGFLVSSVHGSYFTVVGLPVCELVDVLLEIGALSGFPFVDEEESR